MTKPLANKHSIKSKKTDVICPCGAHSARNGQGQTSELRVPGCAACSGMWAFIYGCASCTFSLGLWQMLDADGWCLLMVLYMVLSDTLADRSMARRQQVCWKGCFTFKLLLGLLWLATSWFVSGGCACYLSIRCSYLGKSGESQARRWQRRGKTSSIKAERERMPLKMKATCKHMLASRWKQPATHACKQVFTNTRQQATMSDNRKTKNQVKNNRWIL